MYEIPLVTCSNKIAFFILNPNNLKSDSVSCGFEIRISVFVNDNWDRVATALFASIKIYCSFRLMIWHLSF